jgi:hypothetical protein
MRWYTYDTEVFAHDWIVVFKSKHGVYSVFHNDNEGVRDFVKDEDNIFCGFNTKHYDQYIIKAICGGLSPEEIKQVNDWIIGGEQGWECPLLNGVYLRFNNVDIMDDMQMGLSLKAFEGHLGELSIEESDVDFNLDRHLTQDELKLTVHYCMHDVDATEKLTSLRKDYLNNKMYLGGLTGIEPTKALAMTNAKLTAAYLDARKQKAFDDEREYVYPTNLRREYIPKEVFDFFDRLYDKSIPDEELFKSKLNITVGECPVTLGFGGIHGAIPFYQEEEENGRLIRNYDVASYYPHLMVYYGYTSRNIPNPQIYANMLETRMKAKKSGDKATANALKLVANTTYGAMLNKYNDLYDPLMGRSVCITGQLFLLELSQHLIAECPTLRIVQLNTDGIMVSFDEREYSKVLEITKEWEHRTRFELEEDRIKRIVQKDVNNYVEIPYEDKPKIKGGYLVRGIAPAGAFNINNNATIVAKAIVDYFTLGTEVEITIGECNDIFQFQLIAKAGSKYREAYHIVDGKKESVQKVNRVYATTDKKYGKLFKIKAENDSTAKIEMLPEHCIIDNDNKLTIESVDKSWYIDLAKKRINDFLGIKEIKNKKEKNIMATSTTKNVYQKLLSARATFLKSEVTKSGKNMQLAFKYFELDDIVPIATRIFEEIGLISIVSFTEDLARMTILNTENPDECVVFTAPFKPLEPIVSNTGKKATNEMQALGSSITYMRRYLYMIALDICEPDEIDSGLLGTAPVATPTPTTVVNNVQTSASAPTEKPLTNADGNASELQIKQLKEVLKNLLEADPSQEKTVEEIAIKTKGFTVISKADCETITLWASAALKGVK